MIIKVLFDSITNLMFDIIILFFIFYFIIYFIFKEKINSRKILNVCLIILVVILSATISSNSNVRRYRKYTVDYKEVSTLSFFAKSFNDFLSGETINVSSDNIKVISDRPNDNFKNKNTTYLDIDDGKYIIPVDIHDDEISSLAEELYYEEGTYTYSITVYKNTMLVKKITKKLISN